MTRESLEELSFRNLVEWYSEELWKIIEGESASTVFSHSKVRSLIRHGVLKVLEPNFVRLRRRVVVSEGAREVLGRLESGGEGV